MTDSVESVGFTTRHGNCRNAECNICRGDTHIIGSNPDTLQLGLCEAFGSVHQKPHFPAIGGKYIFPCVNWREIDNGRK